MANKIYKIVIRILWGMIGLLMLSCVGIFLYGEFAPTEVESVAYEAEDKKNSFISKNEETSPDIDKTDVIPEQEEKEQEEQKEQEDQNEENKQESSVRDDKNTQETEDEEKNETHAQSLEEEIIEADAEIDGAYALQLVNEMVNIFGTCILENDGIRSVDGENYYVVQMQNGEGTFLVHQETGLVYVYDELDNLHAFEGYDVEDFKIVEGDIGKPDENCFSPLGFYHGMSFRNALNRVLESAGIEEDIMDYDKVVYNTVSYNSTLGNYGIYDNIEISSRMGDYYFEELPVKLYLKFDRTISGGEQSPSKIERMDAQVTEVRLRFRSSYENIYAFSGKDNLVEKFTKNFGEPEEWFLEDYGIHKYIWHTKTDEIQVLYRCYDIDDVDYWCVDYIAVIHEEQTEE